MDEKTYHTFPTSCIRYPVRAVKFAIVDAENKQIVNCRTVGIALMVADAMNHYQSALAVDHAMKRLFTEASASKK